MSDAFTCPHCGRTSHHPRDREQGYCGACHWWTGDPELYAPWLAERRHTFAPLTLHGPSGPVQTDWCGHLTGLTTPEEAACGLPAGHRIHRPEPPQ